MFHYSSKRLLFSEVEAIFNLSLMNVLEFNDHKNNKNLKWCNTIETVKKTRTTTTIGPISQKKKKKKNSNNNNFARATVGLIRQFCMCGTLFCICHNKNVKLPETSWLHALWRKWFTCSCSLFCFVHCRSFSVWWPLAFLIFYKTFIFPTKFVLRCFLFLALVFSAWPCDFQPNRAGC